MFHINSRSIRILWIFASIPPNMTASDSAITQSTVHVIEPVEVECFQRCGKCWWRCGEKLDEMDLANKNHMTGYHTHMGEVLTPSSTEKKNGFVPFTFFNNVWWTLCQLHGMIISRFSVYASLIALTSGQPYVMGHDSSLKWNKNSNLMLSSICFIYSLLLAFSI